MGHRSVRKGEKRALKCEISGFCADCTADYNYVPENQVFVYRIPLTESAMLMSVSMKSQQVVKMLRLLGDECTLQGVHKFSRN